MTIYDKLRNWATERGLDKIPFDKAGYTTNIIEELCEIWGVPKELHRPLAKNLTELISNESVEEVTFHEVTDGICDISVFSATAQVQRSVDMNKAMGEVHKEINSRTGGYSDKEKKWVKDETKKHLWYKADFSKCKYQEDTHTSYASPVAEHPNGLLENDEAYYHPSWNAKKVLKAYQEIDNASYPNITDIVQIEVDGMLVWGMCK